LRLAQKRRHHEIEQLTQSSARDVAIRQLMRVPWETFAEAYREYPKWQGLVLWTRTVCREEPTPPRIVYETLLLRCPRFLKACSVSNADRPLDYNLSNWIHSELFGVAKCAGWLDALIFFGNRNTFLSRAWDYADACESEWRGKRSLRYPHFDTWWRAVEESVLYPRATASDVAETVESYIEWWAFATWLRPFTLSGVEPPKHVLAELQERCPAFLESESKNSSARHARIGKWLRLVDHIAAHNFGEAQRRGWFENLRTHAAVHPRAVRTAWFSEHWLANCSTRSLSRYPSFLQWRAKADRFTETPFLIKIEGR
jgi:hypothetical protein